MNNRGRTLAILNYQDYDRLPLVHFGFWRETLQKWAGEGKPYTAVPHFYSDLFDLALEAWGDLQAWDQTVLRGTLEGGYFYLFYFAQGRLVGALVGNPSDEERKTIPALVRTRAVYAEVAGRLRDEGVDLRTLVPEGKERGQDDAGVG